MKTTTPLLLALAATARAQHPEPAKGPLNLGLGNKCDDTKEMVSKLSEQLLSDNMKALRHEHPEKCLTKNKVLSYTAGSYHQNFQSCYFESKQQPLNDGQIRYFTMPKKTAQYDPNVQPNLLKELAKNKDQFLIKRIGSDFAAVSKSAPDETLRVFNSFDPAGIRFDRPETVRSAMNFLFLAGKGEVPDFDRALYALSTETSFTEFLKQNTLNKAFEIPAELVKVAVENDAGLNDQQKEFLLSRLDKAGAQINIGKGADTTGKAIRAAIRTIKDECPSSSGGLPMRQQTLTETSLYFPMEWNMKGILEKMHQKKDEL